MRKFVHISDPSSRCSECSPSREGLHRRNRGLAASAAWLAAAVLMGSGSKALWAQEPRVVERPLQQSANISVATGMENPGVLRTELRLVPSASSVTLDRLQVAEDRDSSSRSKQTGDPVNSSQSNGTSRLPKPTDFQERLNPWELGWTKPVAKVGVFEAPDRALVGLWVSAGDVVDAIVPIFATVGRDGTLSEERPGERLGGYGGSAKRVVREGSVVAGFELERGPYFGRSEVVRLRVLWKKLTPDGVNPNVSEESEFFGTGNYAQIQERRWILAEPGSWISGLGALASWHTSGEIFLNDITFLQETPSGSIAWNGGAERGKPSEPVLPEPQPQPTPELPKTNGLINGDFEEGLSPAEGETLAVLYPGDVSTGWRVLNGSVDHVTTFWNAATGKRSLDMSGWEAGTIGQTFATEPGKTYRIVFNLSGNPNAEPVVKRLAVWAGSSASNGQVYEFDIQKSANTVTDMRWESRVFEFVASEAQTLLVFSSLTLGVGGPALDSVRLLEDGQDIPASTKGANYAMYQSSGVPTDEMNVAMRELGRGPLSPVSPVLPIEGGSELSVVNGLVNGDFEESRRAADDSAFVTLYRGDESTGWRVEYGQVDHIGGFWSAGSGKRSLDMNGLVPGTISQTFATEPGKDYRVTFKLSANPDGGPRVRRLIVTTGELNAAEGGPTDGQIYEFDTVKEGSIIHWEKSLFSFNELVKGGHMHWETRLFSFKARDSKTKLIFSSMTLGPYGPALDAVRLLAEDDVSVGASGPDYAMFQTVVDSAGGARLMRTPQFISAWESRWSEAGMAGVGGGESNPLLVDLTSGNPDEDTLPLPVILPPVIEQQPLSAKVLANGWVNLRVQASSGSSETDGSELTYQWLKDGVVLEGVTGAELRRRASENAAGVYTVVVTNEGGSVTSEGATVQVLPAAQLKGVYQGLLLEGAEASIPEADANAGGSALAVGRVTLTLTGQTAFSGRLDYAGVSYRFKGELDGDWTFEKTLSAKGKPPVDLTIALGDSGEGLWVSVQGGQLGEEAKAQASLQRFAFDASKSAVAVGSRYTGGLAPQDQETACWGYLTGSLAKTGIVSVSGKSADGAPVVGSAYLQADGTLALYSELFGALHPYPGQLCGLMSLVDAAGTGRVDGIFTEINFAKPLPRELVTEAESMQTVVLTGSSYQAPSGKQSVLELGAANPLLDLWVIENEGEESFSQIRLAEGNKFEELDPKPLRFRVRLDAATGVVSGKYSDPESGLSWKVFGVVLQADKKVFGFWYGNGQSGSWHLTAPAEESTVPEALP